MVGGISGSELGISADNLSSKPNPHAPIPKPSLDMSLPSSEIDGVMNQGFILAKGESGKQDEQPKISKERAKAREKHYKILRRSGEILPHDHPASIKIKEITERLGYDKSEAICVDSDEFIAHYDRESDSIAISKDVFNIGAANGHATEDKIAFIAAHEKEHSVTNAKSSHAEELRADAEGMERQARAGYDPLGAVEIISDCRNLTEGRYGPTHPETIDRLRHLEDRLADDEHPIPNVGKGQTPLSAEIIEWAKAPSKIYERTDQLIHLDFQTIDKMIPASKDTEEFWTLLELKRHKELIGKARSISEQQNLDELYKNTILLSALLKLIHGRVYLDNSQNSNSREAKSFVGRDKLREADPEKTTRPYVDEINSPQLESTTSGRIFLYAFDARSYRQTVSALNLTNDETEYSVKRINSVGNIIKARIDTILANVSTSELASEYQALYEAIKQSASSGVIAQEVFNVVYSQYDEKRQQAERNNEDESRSEWGLRSSEPESWSKKFNLNDPRVRQVLEETAKISLSLEFTKRPELSEQELTTFQSLIKQEASLDDATSHILSEVLLQDRNVWDWNTFLVGKSKGELVSIIRGLERPSQYGLLRLSPKQEMHEAYGDSQFILPEDKKRIDRALQSIMEESIRKSGGRISALKKMTAEALCSKGLPQDAQERMEYYGLVSPDQLDLTDDEWVLISEQKLSVGKNNFQTVVLKRYIQSGGDFANFDEKLKPILVSIDPLQYDGVFHLSIEEMLVLVEHSPWTNESLMQIFNDRIKQFVISPSSLPKDPEKKQQALVFFKKIYFLSGEVKLNSEDNKDLLDQRDISAIIFKLTTGADSSDLENKILKLQDEGIELNFSKLFSESKELIASLPADRLQALAEGLNKQSSAHPSFKESLKLLALLPDLTPKQDQSNEIDLGHIPSMHTLESISERFNGDEWHINDFLRILGALPKADFQLRERVAYELDPRCVSFTMIDYLTSNYPPMASLEKILQYLEPSDFRNQCLVALWERVSSDQQIEFAKMIKTYLIAENSPTSRKNSNYDSVKNDRFNEDQLSNLGIVGKQYRDLLLRRHAFVLTARQHQEYRKLPELLGDDGKKISFKAACNVVGNPHQRFEALELLRAEENIFLESTAEGRLNQVRDVINSPSIVRDIYIEKIFRDELANNSTNERVLQLGELLLSEFTPDSSLVRPFAIQVLDAQIRNDVSVLADYKKGLELITKYLPKPSVARNYFLDQLEASAAMTIPQLEELTKLRISSEGQEEKGENSMSTFIYDQLAEVSRDDKITTFKWLTNLSSEKPLFVKKLEGKFDGHANSFPAAFAMLTPPEQQAIINRLCLGDQGILDLATISEGEKQAVSVKQQELLRNLASAIFTTDRPESKVFTEVFVNLVLNSEPVKGTHLLSALVSRIARNRGGVLDAPTMTSIVIQECGVVGKKVAQSLAELSWVPDEYKKALRSSQTEAQIVPKRALLVLAEGNGLLDGNKGVKIISFDKLLGAASNKQACMVTVEVTDEKVGMPVGTYRLVGKFKRPSAQKKQNIEHDIKLLKVIVDTVTKERGMSSLPPGFVEGIQESVSRELDFEDEAVFAKSLKADLQKQKPNANLYPVDIPTIVFPAQDVILETEAKGISYREYIDLLTSRNLSSEYQNVDNRTVSKTILTAALNQLLVTGNLHADLHPGNIFVASDPVVTFIDLGMHERLNEIQRQAISELLTFVVMGNGRGVNNALQKLGWQENLAVNFKFGNFGDNVNNLLLATHSAKTPMPSNVSSIFAAISKLSTYSRNLSNREVFDSVRTALQGNLGSSAKNIVAGILGFK